MTINTIVRILRAAALLGACSAVVLTASAQVDNYKGSSLNRAKNIMSGNLVRTTYYNYALVGNIGEISGEWPKGTGDEYIGDASPLVGVELMHPSGDTLHSVCTSDGPRGNSDGPPGGGTFWGFEPLPGFNAPPAPGRDPAVAISDQRDSWPIFWPDKQFADPSDPLWQVDATDPGWAGKWNGYFGKNVLNADQETYFQMDDQADGEWFTRNRTDDPDSICTWIPLPTNPGDAFTITYNTNTGRIHNPSQLYLVWGVNEANHGQWQIPAQSLWPEGTTLVDSLTRTPMTSSDASHFQITLPTDPSLQSVHWYFTDGTHFDKAGHGWGWDNFFGQTRAYYYYPSSSDSTRRGVGLRVAVRGLQWAHFLAQDCIFWLYDITNVGTHTYDKVAFGMVVGTLAGGRGAGIPQHGLSSFDSTNNITYSWSADDAHSPGWVPISPTHFVGYCGYAFLESPGNPFDGIDNDRDDTLGGPNAATLTQDVLASMLAPRQFEGGDHLILIDYNTYQRRDTTFPASGPLVYYVRDERKEIQPGVNIYEDSTNGIDDNFDGLIDERWGDIGKKFKNFTTGQGVNDWMIDEARDDGIDNDHDWNALTDDVGADGVPGTGDTGEGDGRPTNGEPNFDKTDVHESDQIGLTSFDYFTPPGAVRMNDDPSLWAHLQPGHYSGLDLPPHGEDGDFIYGSGYFPLRPGQTERFSMAFLFGEDLPDITQNKITVQQIYDGNYNFARPPDKPTVWAVPGDGKVTLYWDHASELSYDRTCSCNDFEGYKIYRSTDPAFQEVFTVTDGLGRTVFHKPIQQYDLKDGLTGFFPVIRNSVIYYLGEDTGIQNSWTDTTVENGERYYYAVCAYDHGDVAKQILPAENTMTIVVSPAGDVTLDINTVMVTPRAPAAGYIAPELSQMQHVSGLGTGTVGIEVLDPSKVDTVQSYDVTFTAVHDTINHTDMAYNVIRSREATSDTLIKLAPLVPMDALLTQAARFGSYYDSLFNLAPGTYYTAQHFQVAGTDIFDGQRAYMLVPREEKLIPEWSGWVSSSAHNLEFTFLPGNINPLQLRGIAYPADYEIYWSNEILDTSLALIYPQYGINWPAVPVNFKIHNVTFNTDVAFAFQEDSTTANGRVDGGESMSFFETINGQSKLTWAASFIRHLATGDTIPPAPGDTLRLRVYQTYSAADRFHYSVKAAKVAAGAVNLDRIKVYPNPYLAVSNQEPRNIFAEGRGERRITFIHLPNTCTVRIYTVRGELVQTINHQTTIDDGDENWDLRSKDGLNVAYGIYVYHVESPYGEKVGRFAVIK